MTRRDPADRIVALALAMVPCSHLAVWSKAREEFEDVDPSTVWRAMINSGRFQRQTTSGNFVLDPSA